MTSQPVDFNYDRQPDPHFPAEFPASWANAWGEDRYSLWMTSRLRGIDQRLRWIEPGEFRMGSPPNEAEHEDDETPHQVVLSRGFWLADTACTQALWQAVMGNNPSHFQGPQRPVESVSWNEVQQFLERLNALVPDGSFRLPTEAEWEYACRAGRETAFWFGDQITPEQVNYGNNREKTVEVQALPCNGWGLYQMHGNVWEWCQDGYGDYPEGTVVDPEGPDQGGDRVLRGGSWFRDGGLARSAQRDALDPGYRLRYGGFRLARGQAAGEPVQAGEAGRAGPATRSGAGQGLPGGGFGKPQA